ncbi:hypothetical protein NC651_021160 [Populus alba x Populus x berolinensis]|nr:hypothetical protein NC651_021160 [Populus alba x Populus x berolinensis]
MKIIFFLLTFSPLSTSMSSLLYGLCVGIWIVYYS